MDNFVLCDHPLKNENYVFFEKIRALQIRGEQTIWYSNIVRIVEAEY